MAKFDKTTGERLDPEPGNERDFDAEIKAAQDEGDKVREAELRTLSANLKAAAGDAKRIAELRKGEKDAVAQREADAKAKAAAEKAAAKASPATPPASPGRVKIDQDGNVSPLVTSEPKPATDELPPAQAGPPESTGHEHEDE